MKPILWVVSIVLSTLACATGSASGDLGSESGVAEVRPSSFESDDGASCLASCADSYHACLGASEDAVSERQCFDTSAGCEAGCAAQ